MKPYQVNIAGLSEKNNTFHFEVSDDFFEKYGNTLLESGDFQVILSLEKHETFLEAHFKISGIAHLICDRSLEPFDYPVEISHPMIFKFGEENREISDEMIEISIHEPFLDVSSFIYEFIALSIPMKKLHPRFLELDSLDREDTFIYSSNTKVEEEVDPRWEALQKIKNNS